MAVWPVKHITRSTPVEIDIPAMKALIIDFANKTKEAGKVIWNDGTSSQGEYLFDNWTDIRPKYTNDIRFDYIYRGQIHDWINRFCELYDISVSEFMFIADTIEITPEGLK